MGIQQVSNDRETFPYSRGIYLLHENQGNQGFIKEKNMAAHKGTGKQRVWQEKNALQILSGAWSPAFCNWNQYRMSSTVFSAKSWCQCCTSFPVKCSFSAFVNRLRWIHQHHWELVSIPNTEAYDGKEIKLQLLSPSFPTGPYYDLNLHASRHPSFI